MAKQYLRQDAPEAETLHVTSFEECYELMSNLHDCPFDLEEAIFDNSISQWTGKFLRPLWESPEVERDEQKLILSRFLTTERLRVPAAKAVVRVHGVAQVQIVSDQGIRLYTFNELKATNVGIRLDFCEAMRIELDLANRVDVTYDEAHFPSVRLAYTNFPFGSQTGPRVEDV